MVASIAPDWALFKFHDHIGHTRMFLPTLPEIETKYGASRADVITLVGGSIGGFYWRAGQFHSMEKYDLTQQHIAEWLAVHKFLEQW